MFIILLFAACNVGDEGGFAPNIQDNKEGLIFYDICIYEMVIAKVIASNLEPGDKNSTHPLVITSEI